MKRCDPQNTKTLFVRSFCALVMTVFLTVSVGLVGGREAIAAPDSGLTSVLTSSTSQGTGVNAPALLKSKTMFPFLEGLTTQPLLSLAAVKPSEGLSPSANAETKAPFFDNVKNFTSGIFGSNQPESSGMLNAFNVAVRSSCSSSVIKNGTANADSLSGTSGVRNTINGKGQGDTIDGKECDDILNGNGGNDTINGGDGKDTISGGIGNDILQGGGRKDTIYGNSNEDWLFGNGGNDDLFGGPNKDNLFGGPGSDTLKGDGGRDIFWLGFGSGVETEADILDLDMNGDDTVIADDPGESSPLSLLGTAPFTSRVATEGDTLTSDFQPDFNGLEAIDDQDSQGEEDTLPVNQPSQAFFILNSELGRLYLEPDGEGIRQPILIAIVPPGMDAENVNVKFVDTLIFDPQKLEDISDDDIQRLDRLAAEARPAQVLEIRDLSPALRPDPQQDVFDETVRFETDLEVVATQQ